MEVVLNAGFRNEYAPNGGRAAPHHQWLPDVAMFSATRSRFHVAQLRVMGHTVEQRGRQGDAHTIIYSPKTKTAYGANDHAAAIERQRRGVECGARRVTRVPWALGPENVLGGGGGSSSA
jgi:hypothetical protein